MINGTLLLTEDNLYFATESYRCWFKCRFLLIVQIKQNFHINIPSTTVSDVATGWHNLTNTVRPCEFSHIQTLNKITIPFTTSNITNHTNFPIHTPMKQPNPQLPLMANSWLLTLLDDLTTYHYNCLSSGQDFEYESEEAGCLPKEVGANLKSGCYDRKDLEKIYPEEAKQFKQLEQMTNITFDTLKVCICDGNLCNGSIKSVLSISVIIWSVVTGFMLSI